MTTLHIDMSPDGEDWVRIGDMVPGDQYGSVSDNLDDGTRHVYMFGVNAVEGVGEVKRSLLGIDVETPGVRQVDSIALEEVARLETGQQHDMMIKPGRFTAAVMIRFTYGDI